jgi:RNA polymerase sigma-70 factor, ECF subfamily
MPLSTRDHLISELFSESRAALRRYVQRFVRSRDTAEEIVQEAFLRTYEHAQGDKAPKAFLFSVARNLATDHHRHERVARTDTVGDFDTSDVGRQCASLEIGLLADERSRLLKDAIEHLPPQCRTVFILKVFHACSYKEISERLGISARTVENHVARGLRETHQYMRRQYHGVSPEHG